MVACNRAWSSELVAADCATWPECDQRRWLELFGDESSPRPWRRETAYQNAGVYSRYLAATGETWLTRDGVRRFIRAVEARHVCTRTVAGYMAALFKIGRLLRPEADLKWLFKAMQHAVRLAARTAKQRSGVVADAVDVLAQANALIAEARRLGPDAARGRHLFRTGLFLHLGIHGPERLRALGTIRCDQIDFGAGLIRFDRDQIKQKEERTVPLNEVQIALLREWLTPFRAAARPDHGYLWVTESGDPPSIATLYAAVRTETREMAMPMTPKLLRNSAATFIVNEAPEQAETASTVLGHRSAQKRREYTETASMIEASRQSSRILSDVGREVRRRLGAE